MKELVLNNIIENLKTSIQAIEISREEENENMFSSLKNIAFIFEQTEAVNFNDLNQLGQTLKSSIAKIQHIIDEETENRINKKDRFNVFECLTKHHLEELHSRFLAYLLDPQATHDCDDLFLKLFIDTIKENIDIAAEFEDIELDLPNAKLKREKFLGRSYDTDFYGFIDIFIATNEFDIVIENKIGAPEQDDQIYRYINFCKEKNRQHIALYLTLDGNKSDEAGNEKYFCISYDETINSWLNKCKTSVEKYPLVNSGINFYQKLLNEKVLHKSSNKITMEIKDLLLKEENRIILKYLPVLINSQKEINDHFRNVFFKNMLNILNNTHVISTVSNIVNPLPANKIWCTKQSGITFNDPNLCLELGENKKIQLSVEHDNTSLYFGLFGTKLLNGSKVTYEAGGTDIADKINNIMQKYNDNNLDPSSNWWLSWRRFYPLNKEIPFWNYELIYDFATNMDKIVTQFIDEIEAFIVTWNKTIKEINKL